MKTCDDCGAAVGDCLGSRQCSLLPVSSDPRIDPAAAAELRAGRVLCPACARGVPMMAAACEGCGGWDAGACGRLAWCP